MADFTAPETLTRRSGLAFAFANASSLTWPLPSFCAGAVDAFSLDFCFPFPFGSEASPGLVQDTIFMPIVSMTVVFNFPISMERRSFLRRHLVACPPPLFDNSLADTGFITSQLLASARHAAIPSLPGSSRMTGLNLPCCRHADQSRHLHGFSQLRIRRDDDDDDDTQRSPSNSR